MMPRHYFLLLLLCLSAHLCSCSGARRAPDARANAELQAPPVGVKTDSANTGYKEKNTSNSREFPPTSLFNRATDAIGLSTPAGRAARQQRKDARAAVPRSIGKGAVYAPNNVGKIVSGGNKGGPVASADSGAVASNAAENSQQQNVQGDNNDLTARQANPTQEAPGPLAVLADNLTAWVPYVAVGAALLLALWLWRKKKQVDTLS